MLVGCIKFKNKKIKLRVYKLYILSYFIFFKKKKKEKTPL